MTGASPNPPRPLLKRAADAAIGATVEAQAATARGLTAAWELNRRLWEETAKVTAPLRKPLDAMGVTAPLQQAVQGVTERASATLAHLEATGQATVAAGEEQVMAQLGGPIDAVLAQLAETPAVAALVEAQLERILPRLATHPAVAALVEAQVEKILGQLVQSAAVQALIQAQADAYIAYLREHPEVLADLVRAQGDTYIDYLNAHPDAVENLVQGQSVSLAGDVVDEVRERTVTVDAAFEMVLRTVLRRPPREQLPPPSPQVQRRAEFGRLPSDFAPEG